MVVFSTFTSLDAQSLNTPTIPARLRLFFLVVLCSFPAMASPYLPFGPSLRPVWVALSVLMPLIILAGWGRPQAGLLARQTWQWLLPWMAFLVTYLVVALWHQKSFGLISINVSRLLLGALVYASARLIGLRWTHLRWAGWLACGIYGAFALYEWWSAFNPATGANFTAAFRSHLSTFRVGLGANPIALGNQVIWLVGIVVMTQLLVKPDSQRNHLYAGVAAAMGLMACLLTLSRGPLLGLPLLFLLALVFVPPQRRWRAGLLTAALFAVLTLALWILAPENRLFATVGELLQLTDAKPREDLGSGQRLLMWDMALSAIQQWPVLGPGTKGVNELFLLVGGATTSQPAFAVHNHFHSDWIQPLMMGGIVLLLGQLVTIALLVRRAFGNPVLLWIALAPLSFGLTDRVIHENNTFGFFVVAWALYTAAFDNEANQNSESEPLPG
jgi:O-antigen ligase